MDTPTQRGSRAAEFAQLPGNGDEQLVKIVRTAIGEFVVHLVPDAFVRIEFGSVGGECLQAQAGVLSQERTDGIALVDASIVPDDDDATAQVAQEMSEELADLRMGDVVPIKTEIESEALSARTDRYPGDCRDSIVPLPMFVDGSLTARTPCPSHGRYQQEPRFVREDDMGAQSRGVFFTRGHSSRFQRRIASSSRSMALRSGFWQLQPRACNRRPIWLRWYRTSNRTLITSAIRCVVQRSVRYPWDIAPLRRSRRRRSFCRSVSFGGRPGVGLGRNACLPPRRYALRHRITETALHPTRRAVSLSEYPALNQSSARSRRRSNSSAVPHGLIANALPMNARYYYIIYTEVNITTRAIYHFIIHGYAVPAGS